MKRLVFLSILFTIVLACKKDYNKTKQPYKFIPSNTNAVIKVNEINDFLSSVENNEILSNLYNKELQNVALTLKHFNTTKQVYVAFDNKSNSDYIILTEKDSSLFLLKDIPNHISETLEDFNIVKTQFNEQTIYHKIIGNTFAGSNNLELLKTLDDQKENHELSKLIETTDKKSVASILFNSKSSNYSKLLFSDLVNKDSPSFTTLDIDYSEKGIIYNGILSLTDSIPNHFESFKNTVPQKINTPAIAPYNTSSLLSITFDDFFEFNKNNTNVNDSISISSQSFLKFSNEIALINDALILHSLDTNLILESIEDKSHSETFRDIDIYEFGDPRFFNSILKPFISFENATYFSIYNNFIVFAESEDTLKSILTEALNNNTLANADAFKNINENLSDEASLFIFKNSEGISEIFGKNMTGYNANAVQFIHEDNYTHINGVIEKFKKKAATNSVTETFATSLEATILSAPQTVKNHITQAHDIAVQDVNNKLYLISSAGNILWTKQLQGKILGQIEQIDMYKNGRLQLAFTTPNRLYVLDRNGKDVSPFPLKFNDAITQPLAVFDYDNRKDYRLLVTQSKNLLMYNDRGQSVSGFDYKNTESEISSQPNHYRVSNKDYIVFKAGENLQILNRQGNIRINVKDKIRFSDNNVYLYKNKFTTTNTLGQLVQVDTKGRINTTDLNLTDKHQITTTSKTLVSLRENRLIIKSRTIDLDYGDYTAPRIFYLNDKIYVSTTDLQSKKVYLFDSQAKSIPNFPVFGTASATLEKLDGERGLELVTQSDDKTIVVYKLH
ncbi:ribonuclease HII [Winogradskyella bathintestinalis]|uniref:Ribonuclease HII n=1 Tax=Winogradskyella bathintestinalis TaxID=3035208 RepID=A0ABT7ZXR5_9FLAO|nr:ribonuclease HII [Winogradskyella bathintestinalis]MDN3493804.1 ribonuclease HII [Winogradskyella bathintestinalis]